MTTETHPRNLGQGVSVLFAASAAAVLLGALAAVLGGILSGSDAALGALVGTVMVVTVFAGGALVVGLVAGVQPAASLLVALLTYTLQVVAMALVFVVISGSGLLEKTLDAQWLAGAVIVGTIGWMAGQIVSTTRLRLPAYDLTDASAR